MDVVVRFFAPAALAWAWNASVSWFAHLSDHAGILAGAGNRRVAPPERSTRPPSAPSSATSPATLGALRTLVLRMTRCNQLSSLIGNPSAAATGPLQPMSLPRVVPWRDWADIPHGRDGAAWQAQLHVYQYPFYYIDYVLAELVALPGSVHGEDSVLAGVR